MKKECRCIQKKNRNQEEDWPCGFNPMQQLREPEEGREHQTAQQMNMASSLEQDLKKKLGRSKAEKVFRPWWDEVEDTLLNTLVILGFLTLPTAYVTGNPVECVLHPTLWNKSHVWDPLGVGQVYTDQYEEDNVGHPVTTVRITHWYVKRYCTENFVSKFVFYFPYILLIVPLTLVLVDRIFIKTFAAGNKIKQFYELIVEDSLQREDVDTMSRENMKNLHEVMQSFRFSNVCYWSYLSRTCLEIVLSIGLFLIYWCWGMPNLEREIDCDVHGLKHKCVLPNHQFYYYILAVSSALLCVYILCNLYNLVWIVCPQMGTMYRIIRRYREHTGGEFGKGSYRRYGRKEKTLKDGILLGRPPTSCISTDNFLSVYFDRRHKDLKLLLNLLAETSGLPESFRILTLFDKKFQSLWKPQNLRFEEYETILAGQKFKSHSIVVRWNDAPISHFFHNYDSELCFEYTIDITPCPASEAGLKSVLYKRNSEQDYIPLVGNADHVQKSDETPEAKDIAVKVEEPHPNFRYEVRFDNIVSDEEEYTITISTELNGRTVTQTVEKFPVGQPEA